MPLVKKRIFLAAGATSDQVLAGTTYEYVDPNTVIRVAAAVDTASTSFPVVVLVLSGPATVVVVTISTAVDVVVPIYMFVG